MSDLITYRALWYLCKWGDGHVIDNLIDIGTWLPNLGTPGVTHCSLWEPDEYLHFTEFPTHSAGYYVGQCWTSTTRDDANGTVVRPAARVLTHPWRWLYTEHTIECVKFEHAKANAQAKVDYNVEHDVGYAYRNLFRYVMPLWMLNGIKLVDPKGEICSQHIEAWEVDMEILHERLIRSPRRLLKHVVLATHVPVRRLVDDVIVYDESFKKVCSIYQKAA